MIKKRILLIITLLLIPCVSFAATRYVDTTAGACSGNYSIASRNCSGSDGYSYATVQAGADAMSKGDVLYLRGGTYNGQVTLPSAINGTAWTAGNYNTIASYPGEWAVLDGQNSTSGYTLGMAYDAAARKYWLIERLEIKNGRNSGGTNAAGFLGVVGPFWLRYLYIHDNVVSGTDNSFGAGGYHWEDSIIEYCWFVNNGCSSSGCGSGGNSAHITIYSDYNWSSIASSGWNPSAESAYRNTIRYNYATGTSDQDFFKHKGAQYFTRRVTSWQDTYNTYGDKIHHNVLVGPWSIAILCHQDFCQVYNNIIDESLVGISLNYEEDYEPLYKPVAYNNTIISSDNGIQFRGDPQAGQLTSLNGYAYNNIIDANTSSGYGEISMRSSSLTISGWYLNKNYSYRSGTTNAVRYWESAHTDSQFQAQTDTGSPHIYYSQAYNAGNLLYKETSGADKYRIRSDHSITNTAGNTTAGAGGVGGSHPYLSGITIPSYLGAANPSDDAWVAGVLALDSTYFTSVTAGSTPTWVEGATPTTVSTVTGCTISGASMQ